MTEEKTTLPVQKKSEDKTGKAKPPRVKTGPPTTTTTKKASDIKPTGSPIVENDRKKKRKYHKRQHKPVTFRRYIAKIVLDSSQGTHRLSKSGVEVYDDMANMLLRRIADTSRSVCHLSGRKIVTGYDVKSALRLILPHDISETATAGGLQAVEHYSATFSEGDPNDEKKAVIKKTDVKTTDVKMTDVDTTKKT